MGYPILFFQYQLWVYSSIGSVDSDIRLRVIQYVSMLHAGCQCNYRDNCCSPGARNGAHRRPQSAYHDARVMCRPQGTKLAFSTILLSATPAPIP